MENISDATIGERVRHLRRARGLTLDALAAMSGVSRAMISRIERGQASPTAALLGRLCAAFGITLAGFFAIGGAHASPLLRRAEQPVWTDPATGYVRRNVAPRPAGSSIDLVEVVFPAGRTVHFDRPWSGRSIEQVVWMLEGVIALTMESQTWHLGPGDSLHLRLDAPTLFHNPGPDPARYALALSGGT